jgi:hypothetical protein
LQFIEVKNMETACDIITSKLLYIVLRLRWRVYWWCWKSRTRCL